MEATTLTFESPSQSNLLYRWLGSFWTMLFKDEDLVRSWADGQGIMAIQVYLNFLESLDLLSREKAPVFHRERWMPIILKQSQLGTGRASSIKLEDKKPVQLGPQDMDTEYEPNKIYTLGGFAVPRGFVSYPIDKSVAKVNCIMDRIIDPSIVLVVGVDFYVEEDTLFIKKDKDPFKGGFATRTITNNNTEDKELILWCCDALIDREYIYKHFGYVVQKRLESSTYYKQIINKVWDMYVSGSPLSILESAIATILKLPTILNAVEIVEQLTEDLYTEDRLLITNLGVYRYPSNSIFKSKIIIGAELSVGECPVDTIRFYSHLADNSNNLGDFSQNQFEQDISSLLLARGFFDCELGSSLGLSRDSVPILFKGLDKNNNPMFKFELKGAPEDVITFWDTFWRKAEVAKNQTLPLFQEYIHIGSLSILQGLIGLPEIYTGKVLEILPHYSYYDNNDNQLIQEASGYDYRVYNKTYIKLDNANKYMEGGTIHLNRSSYIIDSVDNYGVYVKAIITPSVLATPRLGYTVDVNKKYLIENDIDRIVGYVNPLEFFITNFLGANTAILVIDRDKLYTDIDFISLAKIQHAIPSHSYLFITMHMDIADDIYELNRDIRESLDTAYYNRLADSGIDKVTNNFWYTDNIRLTKYIIECND